MATQETIKQMRVSENGPLRDLEDTTARAGVSALQSALASLRSALDTLMGTDDITDEIDTYNEIKDFLDGFDVNDPDLSSQLTLLNTQVNDLLTAMQTKASATQVNNLQTAVTNLQTAINGKANSADVYPKSQTYNKSEVDDLVDDAGKVKSVTINGVTPPVDNNGNVNLGTIHDGVDGTTPHIGQDGYWYIGTTKTDTKAQGERGNDGVSSADECVVVNNLDGDPADLEEGQVAVLGADQGKELKTAIDSKGVSFKVEGDTLFIRTAASPMVNVLPTSIQFDDTIFGNTRTATVHVYGRNLTNQVEVQVSGVGFSGSTTLLPDIDGKVDEDVTITFAPTASTGTEGDGGRSYDGSVTAVCDDAESASATLEGFGVQSIQPRITATIDKAALKGVLDTTAAGEYSSEPATATLHVQAMNINQVVTLAVDNAKFALSANQISVEDALRGKDITVTYLRQSAVTATDDEGTITITASYDNTDATAEVDVVGTTGAKQSSGYMTYGGLQYIFDGSDLIANGNSSAVGAVELASHFFDDYGYKYVPNGIDGQCFIHSSITSLVTGTNIIKLYYRCCFNAQLLKTVTIKGDVNTERNEMFMDCVALETVDIQSMSFKKLRMFAGCEKLRTVTIRSLTVALTDSDSKTNFPYDTLTIGGVEKEVFYYLDSNNVKQQKILYVPSSLVSSYQADAIWGMFDVQPISE